MERGALFKEAVRAAYVASTGERYSDEALAARAGVSSNTLRRLWTGSIPELGTLIAISNATGISILETLTALQGQRVDMAQPSGAALTRIADALENIQRALPPPREAWSPEEREMRLQPDTFTRPPSRVPRGVGPAARQVRGSTRPADVDETER